MGKNWKFTIIGGAENGMDFTLPGDIPVIVGRSHTASLRVSEPDVSGKHLEFSCDQGSCRVKNLSRFTSRLNGHDLASEATSAISAGDAVEIGRSIKIRVDDVPGNPPEEAVPAQTATSWMEGGLADAPTAIMEESTVTSQSQSGTAAPVAPPTFATQAFADAQTEETHFAQAQNVTRMHAAASSLGAQTTIVNDVTQPPREAKERTQDAPPRTNDASDECETRELETRMGSVEELLQRRQELERKTKLRKTAVLLGLVLIALFLGALWFISRTDAETYSMEFPKNNGVPDAASYILRDANGRALVEVDYPRNPKASITLSPTSNGITVVSYMGRARDVPFYLQLESVSRADELRIDLLQSVRDWLKRAEESGSGFVFDAHDKTDLKFQFFEDVFPGCCEVKSLYGLKFVMLEYKRTWADGVPWHGILIYFRHGDTIFVHRREIPEEYWVRGANRIRKDPNIALYANLIDTYWESPGMNDLPLDRPSAELMARIRNVLSKERASDWRFLKKDLDAVLIKSWREDPHTRKSAEDCLRQFREVQKTYYYGKFNAFLNAKDNRDTKKMNKFRQDCEMVFDDRNERYYFLIGNSEVW